MLTHSPVAPGGYSPKWPQSTSRRTGRARATATLIWPLQRLTPRSRFGAAIISRSRGGLTSKIHPDGRYEPPPSAGRAYSGRSHDKRRSTKILSPRKSGAILMADCGQCRLDRGTRRSARRVGKDPTTTEPRRTLLHSAYLCRRMATRYDELTPNYLGFPSAEPGRERPRCSSRTRRRACART